ncbi:UNVERIFIED_CONTAM: hypothetical protein FKN15_026754 [Acipenser sinensis]
MQLPQSYSAGGPCSSGPLAAPCFSSLSPHIESLLLCVAPCQTATGPAAKENRLQTMVTVYICMRNRPVGYMPVSDHVQMF